MSNFLKIPQTWLWLTYGAMIVSSAFLLNSFSASTLALTSPAVTVWLTLTCIVSAILLALNIWYLLHFPKIKKVFIFDNRPGYLLPAFSKDKLDPGKHYMEQLDLGTHLLIQLTNLTAGLGIGVSNVCAILGIVISAASLITSAVFIGLATANFSAIFQTAAITAFPWTLIGFAILISLLLILYTSAVATFAELNRPLNNSLTYKIQSCASAQVQNSQQNQARLSHNVPEGGAPVTANASSASSAL